VIVAGVLANFFLAIVVFSLVYSFSGIPTKTEQVKIVGIIPDSPAQKAGLKEKDVVVGAGDKEIKNTQDFIKITKDFAGKPMALEISREKENPCKEGVLGAYPGLEISCHGENLVLTIVPREKPPEGEGPLGVVVSSIEMKKYPFWQMPFRGTIEGFKEAFGWTILIFGALGKMLVDLISRGTIPKDIAGPVGIFQITGVVVGGGVFNVLQFIGILSVNLAVINILPFPALDGGRFIFVAYEAITHRRPKPTLERWVNTAGMAFLLFLIILVTINDIKRMIETTDLLSLIRGILPF
jgi:regulator of sigma E protease